MTNRSLAVLLVAAIAPLLATTTSGAHTRWNRFASSDEGFSIEVPGDPEMTGEPGHYVYSTDDWSFIIKVDSNSDAVRDLVAARAREPLAAFLQKIASGLTGHGHATLLSSSSADFEGYPSLLISIEDEGEGLLVQGIDRLVLTEEHLYMLITVARRGSPKDAAERFLESFHLTRVAPNSGGTAVSKTSASTANPLVVQLTGPMLSVARLITQEHLNPRIDQVMQHVPGTERLGNRWGPANPAWPQARHVITRRIELLTGMYETSGELESYLESALAGLSADDTRLLTQSMTGPAGAAILRSCASIEFVSRVMSEDPNGPKAGDRAWNDKLRALNQLFNERAGKAMPQDDGAHAAEVSQFLNGPAHRVAMNVWSTVIGKATNQLDGVINLMIFDDRDNIAREIDAVIAAAN
jgi:hypothetical protein